MHSYIDLYKSFIIIFFTVLQSKLSNWIVIYGILNLIVKSAQTWWWK